MILLQCVTLVLSFLSVVIAEIYSNQFAVHIYGGEKVASSLALKYGFRNHGQIGMLQNHYLFSHQEVHKRSTQVSNGMHMYLAQEPQVHFLEQQIVLDRSKRDINIKAQLLSQQWYLRGSNASSHHVYETWKNGFTGKGVVVSVLDDGIEWNHPDLKDNYEPRASYDYNDNDPNPIPRYDALNTNKHGTRCAGVVSMAANNTICGVGIAYEAKIGGIRMLDGDVTDAVEASALSYNPHIIDIYSSSWGPNDDGKTVEGPGLLATIALEVAVTEGRFGNGSIIVWASGNGGLYQDDCNCDGYANSIYTLSVSGVSESGKESWYAEECSSILATTFSSGDVTQRQVVTTDLRGECTEHHTGTSASAPMAAAMCALALQANPGLSWRDMQYIVAVTSNHESLQDADWKENGAGYFVSNRYGFGLMNANLMTQLASVWKPLPKQNICEIKGSIQSGALSTGRKLKLHLSTVGHCGNQVKYLEHVQVRITLMYSARGNLNILLTSPLGTHSRLLSRRPHDVGAGKFQDWPFMTTHNWGELSNGTWTLEIEDTTTNSHHSGELYSWFLVLYGTDTLPSFPTSTDQGMDIVRRKARAVDQYQWDDSYDYYSYDYFYSNCHEQCYPPAGCDGVNADDCYKCKMYRDRDTDECVEECPDGQFPPPESHQRCRYCNKQCKTCFGHGVNNCLSCDVDHYLREDVARCVQSCDNGFYADENKVCKLCDFTCYTCANSEFCTSCPIGLYMNPQNRCVVNCDDNEYISDDSKCLPCDEACSTCNGLGPEQCLSCKASYVKKENMCIQYDLCPSDHYIDDDDDECVRCHPVCAECDGPEDHDCTKCTEHYVLVDDHCLESCGDQQFVNEDGNCADCPRSCKTCVTNTTCIECLDGWVVANGGCQEGCLSGMYEMDNACYNCHSTCSKCTGGDPHDCIQCNTDDDSVRYLYNHQCILACPDGYFGDKNQVIGPQCTKCDETCATCDGPNHQDCVSCMDGLVWNEEMSICTEGSFVCPTTCKTCSKTWQCTECIEGTYLYNRDCVQECPPQFVALTDPRVCGACHPSCDSCNGISHHECSTCIPSYFITPDNTCEPDCIWFDGTYPDQNKMQCSPCHSRCAQCLGPEADNCIVCADGRFLKALEDASGLVAYHRCVEASDCGNDSYADETINECVPCYPTCNGCTGPGDLDCIECRQDFSKDLYGICQSGCNSGQYKSESDCQNCHETCLSCKGDEDSDCLTCDVARFLMPSGECVNFCSDTTYPDFEDNICKPCFQTCQTCVSYESSECLTCKADYYLHMGRYCYAQCPVGYYEYSKVGPRTCRQCSVECKDCTGNYLNCTKCDSEYLYQGRCLDQCPVGYEGALGVCVIKAQQEGYHCPPFCQECIEGICIQCEDSYTLYFGGCLEGACQNNEYFDGENCIACDVSCRTCLGITHLDCLSCPYGKLLENGECVESCPEGSYKDDYTNECGDCHPTCNTCNGPSQFDCVTCQNAMYLSSDNSCHNECPPGFYYDEVLDCQQCDASCRTCNGPSGNDCVGCPRETYLLDNQCVGFCPIESGYYHFLVDESDFVSSTNECRRCSINCQTCFGGEDDECTSCKVLLFLKGNECLINCGTFFYEVLESDTCKHCDTSCESCSGPLPEHCLTCSTDKYLVAGVCFDEQPQHYYCINTAYGKECRPCHASCLTCSKGGGVFDCDACHPGHIYDDGICYPRCATGTYFIANNSSSSSDDNCGQCLSPCHDCYGKEPYECITCENGKEMHHIDKQHHYCVTCCAEGQQPVEGICCECNMKTGRCRPGVGKEDTYKGGQENNDQVPNSHVAAIVLSCLGVIILFFIIFGLLQARSNRTCCFPGTYEQLPTYYNGSNVQVVLAKEPPMSNKHEYMSPDEEETDEYPSDDDDDDAEEIY